MKMVPVILIPTEAKDSFLDSVQTGSGVHPASYTEGNRGSFTGSKTAGA
jgi:hypothetical protein